MNITNATIYTGQGVINGWLTMADGQIVDYSTGEIEPSDGQDFDAGGGHLLPGFVDVHVHGGANTDTMDATPQSIETMARFYAQHGVTSFLATTWTDSEANITAALENARNCMGKQSGGATLRGVHLEGPYLNPKRSGAQSADYIRRAGRDEAMRWLDMDVIRLLSLAPEYEENHWLINECVQRDITVSAAHTDATYEEIVQAAGMGLSHSTHTFNAMTVLHHRQPGTVGAMLSLPQITCEIIADNIHVHPAVMRLLWNAKRGQNIVLITDAIRAAGMPDGDYPVDERIVHVRDGVAQLGNGTLAGSTLTMDRALRNFIAATGASLEAVYPAATRNPARVTGIDALTGSIEVGKQADLVLLDDDLQVRLTVVGGEVVYQN